MKTRVISLLTCFLTASVGASDPVKAPKDSASAETNIRWQERAAQQAHILSHLKWTPVAETMPSRSGGYFKKGKAYTGAPYSSVRSAQLVLALQDNQSGLKLQEK